MVCSRRGFLGRSAGLATALALPQASWAKSVAGDSRTLVIGMQSMRTLNPAVQSGYATGMPGSQLFASLVLLDDKFEPLPYLARSWEVSEDGLSYRFQLVNNATFHDGRPIKASDVVFSIETVKAVHPLMSIMYKAILESVRALDDHAVELRLKKPFAGMFSVLTPSLTPILPEHIYGPSAGPIRTNPANDQPVGSGPYKFVSWQRGKELVLERHAGSFRAAPYFDRLVFTLIEDSLTKTLMLEKGAIDFLPFSYLRVSDLKRIKGHKDIVMTHRGYEAIGPVNYLELNLRVAPLNDIRVRQALAHAINKDFITTTLHQGLSKRLDGPLHSSNAYFDGDVLTQYPYDLTKANQLLDAAGLPKKGDGMRIQLTLDIPTFEPDSTNLVADYLKGQLRRIGVDVVLRKSTDFADWASKIGQWNYQMTMNSTFNWSDPVVGVDRSFLSSNIAKQVWTNTEGYVNPQVDEILARAASEADPGKRRALYSEFQKIVSADLPFIWTNEGIYITIHDKKLRDIPSGVFGALAPFDEMSFA